MKKNLLSDQCLIEIKVLGMHVRAIGPLAVLIAGVIVLFFVVHH